MNCALKSCGLSKGAAGQSGRTATAAAGRTVVVVADGTGEEITVLGLGLGGSIIGKALASPGVCDWLLALGRWRGATLVPLSSTDCFDVAEPNEGVAEFAAAIRFASDSKVGSGIDSKEAAGMFWKGNCPLISVTSYSM